MRPYIGSNRHINKLLNGMLETTMKGKIIITYTPKNDYDLVSKEYVDNIVNNLDLSKIEGTVSKNSFPNYPGDFVKTNNEYMLRNKATSFTKPITVTISENGLVTKGSNKIPPELFPDVDNTIIDKTTYPKTPEEMGITDAVKLDGTGKTNKSFIYKEAGTRADAPTTRNKADSFFNPLVKYNIGDIILVEDGTSTEDNMFQPVNGSSYNKVTYSALYSIIGDSYGSRLSKDHGIPWKCLDNYSVAPGIDHIDDFKIFDAGEVSGLAGFSLVVTKNKVYYIGGYRGDYSKISNQVFMSTINNGIVSKPTRVGDLPIPLVFAKAIAVEDTVYLIGGARNPLDNNDKTPVYKAAIKPDGTLGPWVDTKAILPHRQLLPIVYVHGRRVYSYGGLIYDHNSTPSNVLFTPSKKALWFEINLNGDIPTSQTLGSSSIYVMNNSDIDHMTTGVRCWSYELYGGPVLAESFIVSLESIRSIALQPTLSATTARNMSMVRNITNKGTSHTLTEGIISYMYGNNAVNRDDPFAAKKFTLMCRINTRKLGGSGINVIPIEQASEPRAYHEVFGVDGRFYVVGGIGGDPSISTTTHPKPKSFSHKVSGFYDDYSDKYSQIPYDPNIFSIPTLEPVVIGNTMYNYYIKVK